MNGGERETVHVPAGTFSAVPVTIIQDYDIGGRGTTVESTYDVAPGVGTVRITIVTTQGESSQRTTETLLRSHGGSSAAVEV